MILRFHIANYDEASDNVAEMESELVEAGIIPIGASVEPEFYDVEITRENVTALEISEEALAIFCKYGFVVTEEEIK